MSSLRKRWRRHESTPISTSPIHHVPAFSRGAKRGRLMSLMSLMSLVIR